MNRIVYILLFLGILLRVLVLLQNHSFSLDEANVVRNVAEKSNIDFFQPLDYQQYAPPFFMSIEKGVSSVLGSSEFSLRLPIVFYSIVLLLLFWQLGNIFFEEPLPYLFALALLCFGSFFVRYSVEVKQYMSDGMVALTLLLLALKTKRLSSNWILAWAFLGGLAVWFSMPSVFVLATLGFYFMWNAYRQKEMKEALIWVGIAGFWLINFGVYYFLILRNDLSKDILTDYHSTYFFPLIPTNAEALDRFFNLSLSFFRASIGYTVIAYITGIGLFLLGCFVLWGKQKGWLFLLGFPMVLCLIASNLGYYSLMPRLTLFFLPLMLLILSFGFEYLWKLGKLWVQIPLVALCLLTVAQQKGLEFFFKPFEIEEVRPILTIVKEKVQENELVLIHQEAVPAVAFYQKHHINKEQFSVPNTHFMHWRESEKGLLNNEFSSYQRVWLIASHLVSDENRQEINNAVQELNEAFLVLETIDTTGAKAILFEKRN